MYDNPQLANLGFSDVDVYCVEEGGEMLGPRRAPSKTTYRKSLHTGLALCLFILGKMIWGACCLADETTLLGCIIASITSQQCELNESYILGILCTVIIASFNAHLHCLLSHKEQSVADPGIVGRGDDVSCLLLGKL